MHNDVLILGHAIDPATAPVCAGARFLSNHDLSQYRLLVIDIGDEVHSLVTSNTVSMDDAALLERRAMEVCSHVESGETAVVICRQLPWGSYNNDTDCSIESLVRPFWPLGAARSGSNPEHACDPSLNAALEPLLKNAKYEWVLKEEGLQSLARGRHKGGLVAAYRRHGEGYFIFLPPLPPKDALSFLEPSVLEESIEPFKNLDREIRQLHDAGETALPLWASEYVTTPEADLLKVSAEIAAREEELRVRREANETELRAERAWKRLFTAQDPPLEHAVLTALKELGFEAEPGPKTHADIIAKRGTEIVVLEVYGRDEGPAETKKVRQLKWWIGEWERAMMTDAKDPVLDAYRAVFAKLGIEPSAGDDERTAKGILVVNGFRNHSLSERSRDVFPAPVVSQLAAERFCGVTGLQLFGMVRAAREGNLAKAEAQALLLDTVGVVKGYDDWSAFLSKPPNTKRSTDRSCAPKA